MKNKILDCFNEHILIANLAANQLTSEIEAACKMVIDCLKNGNKILLFGNGGSAADAQHIAAEFTGRFVKERRGLPAIALTTDTSALTAISNDYGFAKLFERQVEALANPGDVLIGLSTSGNSENVINALVQGNKIGCKTIGLTGKSGGLMSSSCNINIIVPSENTARIQEIHILIGHIICMIVDDI